MGLRRLITEFLWPPSAPSSDPGYHIVSKYSSRRIKSPNSMGLRRLITEFLWPPSSSINRPWLPYSIKYSSRRIKPKLDGLCRLITEFLWPPSSSINRSALYNIALSSYLYMHAIFQI
ncbi:hypothetical protein EVAR_70745_1 [Eumeta japonica]|uniref:Uncharacterized protein n=1 Tax=Eumeta variegata TaxID=151549 RepID=A0A4C2A7W5_EUMVA|nr:hypothetical protein EVAR_70745_1 [Eumeta japonica]